MNTLVILYAGSLAKQAFESVINEKNAIELSLEQAKKFPGAGKIVLLTDENNDFSNLTGIQVEKNANWTKRSLLEKISSLQTGFDCVFFAFADCPFLDPVLASSIADRHIKYAAEYSYADGFPYGLAPEIISVGTAGILVNILGDDDGPIERDMLFSIIQKDINAFDIEAEISSVDLRCHRINLCADSKRNHLLLKNFISAAGDKIPSTTDVERIVEENPQILRTLPSFFPIQVYGSCPQKCTICPYPAYTDAAGRKDFMKSEDFEKLLENIITFCTDAVIDLSLWGELSLHPEKLKLIEAVLKHKELALIIETSGLGWKNEELEACENFSKKASAQSGRINPLPPLSWIVSLDTVDPLRYTELRGTGFGEAMNCAKKLLSLFPNDCYIQAVRTKGSEDDTEKFYRHWKEASPNGEKNIIIQKYDCFSGALEKKQASDISPVTRQCCWHIMRDLPILIDGTVPLCKEDLSVLKGDKTNILGNVFTDSLETIWQNGNKYYIEQCNKDFTGTSFRGLCAACDEYYTYNF